MRRRIEYRKHRDAGVSKAMEKALEVNHSWPGFKGVGSTSVYEWNKDGGTEDRVGKGGRKVVAEAAFDVAVLSKLIVTKIDPQTCDVLVTANVGNVFI